MIENILKKLLKNKPVEKNTAPPARKNWWDNDLQNYIGNRTKLMALADLKTNNIQRTAPILKDSDGNVMAMDSMFNDQFGLTGQLNGQVSLIDWYGSQSFIGYQLCAILAQNWLIDKACTVPAKDAIRKGFEITVNSKVEISPDILDAIRQFDIRYNLDHQMIEFVRFGRIYGIRIALFVVDGIDYEKPFNIDGVRSGSYKGISQIDPYWITPELDADAAANPASMYFYEPTWWVVNGKRIHRTHLCIMRTPQVADVLKPTYFYGGVPIPQKVYERVYAAERTANEAPMLAMTKRCDVLKIDVDKALAKQKQFEKRILQFVYNRDNYGIKTIGLEEDMVQFDTSLADLDAVIMTQYQLVAAAVNMPAVKLLGTSPKGFNATGEYEEASYHEELESIQANDLTPFVQRHHLLAIKSYIAPTFGIEPFATEIRWNELDSMTSKEVAEKNKMVAETDSILALTGAINGEDIRNRLINDPDSGYNGIGELDNEEIDFNLEDDPDINVSEKINL